MKGRDLLEVRFPLDCDAFITHVAGYELPTPVRVPAGCIAVDIGNKSRASVLLGLPRDPRMPDHALVVVEL